MARERRELNRRRGAPWLLLALAIATRVYGCAITPVPGRDGVAYLWLAERFAAGDLAALFSTVFHPLYPLLVGLTLLPGDVDSVRAGQLVAAGCGALAVVPLWLATRALFGSPAAIWAGVIYAIGVWFVRHPAECMSEGPFYLLAATWAAWLAGGHRARAGPAGVAAGLAFLCRPEGAALLFTGVLWLLARAGRRPAIGHGVAGLLVGAALPLGMLAAGEGFSLTPKAAFNWDVGAGAADSAAAHYLMQWLRWPGDAWEGLGYLVFPLLVAGAIRHRPRALSDPRLCLLLPFVAQLLVVPLLKSHHRFASGLGVLLLPFGGIVLAELLAWGRRRAGWLPWAFAALLVASEAKLFLNPPNDRTIERDLGRWLATARQPAETVASDMPRLVFFAGLRPPPPRRIEPADLLAAAALPDCGFVVLKRGRTALPPGALAELGYRERPLPAELATHPHGGEIALLRR